MKLKNIVRIEGERNYSFIYMTNQKKKLASKTLGDLEELLNDKGFFRSHKSHLINFSHIQSYPNSTSAVLSEGTTIPIARQKKRNLKLSGRLIKIKFSCLENQKLEIIDTAIIEKRRES